MVQREREREREREIQILKFCLIYFPFLRTGTFLGTLGVRKLMDACESVCVFLRCYVEIVNVYQHLCSCQ